MRKGLEKEIAPRASRPSVLAFRSMQSHGPKRVYTPQSLEFWFGKLENDWAEHFTAQQLDEGRRIYRAGEVRELELTAKDAIIHRRIEKKDEYAVIEWDLTGFSVRSSSTDKDLAHALAVAGLHEIEELVCDEISPLPDVAMPAPTAANGIGAGAPKSPSQSNGSSNGATVGSVTGATKGLAKNGSSGTAAGGVAPSQSRVLVLVFQTQAEGLKFQAYWRNADKTKTLALGQSPQEKAASHATSSERAKLIGLAAYARKAHFTYTQSTGIYLLESVAEIPNFLKVTLPAWKRLFAVELDELAANLLKGPRSIEIEAVASQRRNGQGLDLRWIFKAGERF